MRSLAFITLFLIVGCSAPNADAADAGHRLDAGERPDASERPGAAACWGFDMADGGCGREARTLVPARDGVRLETWVRLPASGGGPWPSLLLRTPYALTGPDAPLSVLEPFLDEGVAVVVQACRGTAHSQGALDPLKQEFPDGRDAVKWIASQPWSNGRIGTIGASYEGFTALAASVDSPEVKVVIADGNISDAFTGWPGQRGVWVAAGLLWWLREVEAGVDLLADDGFWSTVTNDRPPVDLDVHTLGVQHATWRAFAAEADRRSTFWDERSLTGKLKSRCVPRVFFQAANEWADDPLDAYRESAAACPEQRFVLGSGSHAGVVYAADPRATDLPTTLKRAYVRAFLEQDGTDLSGFHPVSVWVNGAATWKTAESWPPASRTQTLFPAGSTLAMSAPAAGAFTLTFDPNAVDACTRPDHPAQATFLSEPLAQPIEVVGAPEVVALLTSDVPDADLSVTVYEVTAAGEYPWYVQQRLRLRFRAGYTDPTAMPLGTPTEVRVKLGTSARRIAPGDRIGVQLSMTECGLPENPGTFGPMLTETQVRTSTLTLSTGPTATRLELPVTP